MGLKDADGRTSQLNHPGTTDSTSDPKQKGLTVGKQQISVVSPQPVGTSEEKDESVTISMTDYVLQYGPKTVQAIIDATNSSFKLFWDGSISLFKDTAHSSKNNKDFLRCLFEMRLATQDH